MKKETALGIGLKLLGLAFSIGPLLIAFSINGWDVRATLINQEELNEIQSLLGGLFEKESGGIQINAEDATYDNLTQEFRLPVVLSIDLPFSIDIVDFRLSAQANGQQLTLSMRENKITLMPGENTEITLVGRVPPELYNAELTQIQGSMTFEKYGVTIQVTLPEGGV